MNSNTEQAIQYLRDHRDDFLARLKEYVTFPSISTDPERFVDVERCASWVADYLRKLGMQNVTIFPTARNPVVYGEYLGTDEGAPVVLIYGHYDVQPPDPLDLWSSPPFEAQIRGDQFYGRGIADMKGQLISCLAAIEAVASCGPLPVNLKFLIEGEEEIGSPNLNQFIPAHKDLLACDFALNLDAGTVSADQPTITYGMRGIAVFELTVSGPEKDLHSGLYGGAVANPVQVLCRLVGEMQDENGRIQLPGYYDRVRELDVEERAELNRTPMDAEYILQQTGSPRLWGEAGYSAVEHIAVRPTLDVNGIYGGYSGPGIKTIIPASATAKISMRLVPNQNPKEIAQQLRQFVAQRAPDTVRWEVKELVTAAPAETDRKTLALKAMDQALQAIWGRRPLYIRLGGSVPVIAMLEEHLQVKTVTTGFIIFSEAQIHSPDENLHLPTWYRGMEALVHYFLGLS